MGNRVSINMGCVLLAMECIVVGDNTRIAERVSIRDQDHDIRAHNIVDSGFVTAPITIGRDCWLGANVVVTKGVTIGDRCVVGAGSVVTRDIPSGSVAVGAPARVVRSRFA